MLEYFKASFGITAGLLAAVCVVIQVDNWVTEKLTKNETKSNTAE